ncbi:hypothetical protein WDU94_010210 [Cyamophila willieti]
MFRSRKFAPINVMSRCRLRYAANHSSSRRIHDMEIAVSGLSRVTTGSSAPLGKLGSAILVWWFIVPLLRPGSVSTWTSEISLQSRLRKPLPVSAVVLTRWRALVYSELRRRVADERAISNPSVATLDNPLSLLR